MNSCPRGQLLVTQSGSVSVTGHLDCIDAAVILMKAAPDSFANALASIVFPVPGGPAHIHLRCHTSWPQY